MKKIFVLLTLLILSTNATQLRGETSYFQEYEIVENKKAYVEKLTAKELIFLARQLSEKVEEEMPQDNWDEGVQALAFFYVEYPKKTNNLKDITAIVNELQNKSQPSFWRNGLMEILSLWYDKLGPQRSLDIANIMMDISNDSSELSLLRAKGILESTHLVVNSHKLCLYADPNVRPLITGGKKYKEILKEVNTGEIDLTDETIKMKKTVEASMGRSIQLQINLLADTKVATDVKNNIISTLVRFYEYDVSDSQQIKQILDNAVHNYRNYDESLWRYLASIGANTIKLADANDVVADMINEMQTRFKAEEDKKKKNQIQNEIKSLKRIIKKQELKRPDDPNAAEMQKTDDRKRMADDG